MGLGDRASSAFEQHTVQAYATAVAWVQAKEYSRNQRVEGKIHLLTLTVIGTELFTNINSCSLYFGGGIS